MPTSPVGDGRRMLGDSGCNLCGVGEFVRGRACRQMGHTWADVEPTVSGGPCREGDMRRMMLVVLLCCFFSSMFLWGVSAFCDVGVTRLGRLDWNVYLNGGDLVSYAQVVKQSPSHWYFNVQPSVSPQISSGRMPDVDVWGNGGVSVYVPLWMPAVLSLLLYWGAYRTARKGVKGAGGFPVCS